MMKSKKRDKEEMVMEIEIKVVVAKRVVEELRIRSRLMSRRRSEDEDDQRP